MYNAALLKAIIENAIDGIIVIDEDGYILLVNPSACSLFGYTTKELYGENIGMLMPPPDSDLHNEYLQRYRRTKQPHIIGIGREVMGQKKNRSLFPVRLAVSEVKYYGKSGYVGIIHDVSLEKEAEMKLQQHNSELESVIDERTRFLQNMVQTLEQTKEEVKASLSREKEFNQLKTRFVSMASHEFRTPLSSILLSASLVEHYYDRLDKGKIFLHLEKIKSAVNSLAEILNDFLSVEKIESGKLIAVRTNFDIKKLCGEIVEEMQMQAKSHQKIDYIHVGKVSTICLDNNLLRHCLINLISNAIKYSCGEKVIEVKTEVIKSKCRIVVKDNGIGIPKQDQVHLFEAFFRAQNTIDIEGTGLGLNIVKRYTDLMNGQISFESSENIGSVFTLTFPVKA
jgi:two-component system, LuxR family, sensor kinase FixL